MKKILLFGTMAVLIFSLTACSGNPEAEEQGTEPTQAVGKEVTGEYLEADEVSNFNATAGTIIEEAELAASSGDQGKMNELADSMDQICEQILAIEVVPMEKQGEHKNYLKAAYSGMEFAELLRENKYEEAKASGKQVLDAISVSTPTE